MECAALAQDPGGAATARQAAHVMIEHHLSVARTARYYTVGGEGGDASETRELWVVCRGYGQLAARFLEPFVPLATPWRRIVAPEGLSRFYHERARVGVNTEAGVGAT